MRLNWPRDETEPEARTFAGDALVDLCADDDKLYFLLASREKPEAQIRRTAKRLLRRRLDLLSHWLKSKDLPEPDPAAFRTQLANARALIMRILSKPIDEPLEFDTNLWALMATLPALLQRAATLLLPPDSRLAERFVPRSSLAYETSMATFKPARPPTSSLPLVVIYEMLYRYDIGVECSPMRNRLEIPLRERSSSTLRDELAEALAAIALLIVPIDAPAAPPNQAALQRLVDTLPPLLAIAAVVYSEDGLRARALVFFGQLSPFVHPWFPT